MDKSKFAVSTYNKIANIYTQKYFDDLSDAPYIDKFLQYLGKDAKILDVGCGPGTFIQYLLDKGFHVEGIDLSEEMIRIAKQKIPNTVFKVMDMRTLSYDNNTFDGLLIAYSLIHIATDEIEKVLKEFFRVLKSKGIIMTITQKGEPDKIVTEPLKKDEKMFINFFTKQRLFDYLEQAGFNLLYQEETNMQDIESLSDKVIYTIAKK